MNHSIYSVDRTTHLKIVVVALVAGIAVAGLAISSRVGTPTDTIAVIKAGKAELMGSVVMLTRRREEFAMRYGPGRAGARARARLQALPQSQETMLWSIGALLSAAMVYLAWVS
jgi:hypothetical protein